MCNLSCSAVLKTKAKANNESQSTKNFKNKESIMFIPGLHSSWSCMQNGTEKSKYGLCFSCSWGPLEKKIGMHAASTD